MKKFITALSIGILVCTQLPAYSAVKDCVDMPNGNNVSVGLFGLSYDYVIDAFGIGASIGKPLFSFTYSPAMNLGLRAHYRFLNSDNLSAGVLAAVNLDPGTPSDASGKLIPDVGVGVAYTFEDIGLSLRLNLTFTSSWTGAPNVFSYSGDTQAPNFLQTITIGPNTSFEIGYRLNETAELTLGGGSLVGIRMNF